ncbi:MAG: hypothetical protein HY794_18250 [Desulfarculus sp.]|nr:hypothetical protein [Desulfarculus sp.]
MASTLTAKLEMKIAATLSQAIGTGLGSAAPALAIDHVEDFSDGTGANQAQLIYADTRTLAASATEELDLAASLKDALGRTLTFTAIKALFVRAADGNANNVEVGGAAANGFIGWAGDPTDKLVLRPGGAFMLLDPGAGGYAVTAGTGDLLKIANSGAGTGVTYDIVIMGEGTAA